MNDRWKGLDKRRGRVVAPSHLALYMAVVGLPRAPLQLAVGPG